jgi:hypothetical protein
LLTFILTVIWLGVAGTALIAGLDYYLLPLQERAFSEMAGTFSPTGVVGQGLGVVGATMIVVGMAGYSARKRISFLSKLGPLRRWLQVHIFLCTLGPFLVLLHTTFKFGGIVSIAFWSMAIVVASGVFGRYVYVRIPKTVNGSFLASGAVGDTVSDLTRRISDQTGLSPAEVERRLSPSGAASIPTGLVGALAFALREDFRSRRKRRGWKEFLSGRGLPVEVRTSVLSLAEEHRRLHQQALLLGPFQRMFRYWHVIHLPLAIVMLLILSVHVGVSILFGYTWIF